MEINSISIDSTNSITDLCFLGTKHPTDKSPYNTNKDLHKHAYTSIYNLLFSNIRYEDIYLGEIGILDNHSMMCWREFFPNANLFGYEWFDSRLEKAVRDGIDCTYIKMDVTNPSSIEKSVFTLATILGGRLAAFSLAFLCATGCILDPDSFQLIFILPLVFSI